MGPPLTCTAPSASLAVAFKIYDIDGDGFITNGELFTVLKMMVGDNLGDVQLQQVVDKTMIFADKDKDGKVSFEEFCDVRACGQAPLPTAPFSRGSCSASCGRSPPPSLPPSSGGRLLRCGGGPDALHRNPLSGARASGGRPS